jgi:DNA polymerase-3 subunit beta
LIIDTQAIRYRRSSADGQFPDYENLLPMEFNTAGHLDILEAINAAGSFKALSDNPKSYPIDLTIGDGRIVMANPDHKGEAMISADTDGQGSVRVNGKYLAEVLKACGGTMDLKLVNADSPMLLTADSYQVVVMPIMSSKAGEQPKQDKEAKAA